MPDYVDNPHVLAEAWRRSLGLSRAKLAKLTGYSMAHIRNMENGINHATRRSIPARSFVRYRLACAAVHAGLEFDFRSCVVGSTNRQRTKAGRDLDLR